MYTQYSSYLRLYKFKFGLVRKYGIVRKKHIREEMTGLFNISEGICSKDVYDSQTEGVNLRSSGIYL